MIVSGVNTSTLVYDPAERLQDNARTNRANPAQTRTLQSGDGDSDVNTAYQRANPTVERIADQTSATSSAMRSGQNMPQPQIAKRSANGQQAGRLARREPDPRDSDADGEVTEQEQAQFNMQTLLDSMPAAYTPKGRPTPNQGEQTGSLVNLFG